MNRKKLWYIAMYAVVLVFVSALFVFAESENVVYLRDGGNGDGSSYEKAIGDFKEAVRILSESGGKIVVCGKYTVNRLVNLSSRSGTANGNKKITVTSVYKDKDYRTEDMAALCIGDEKVSANIVLAGEFVFENINIVTNGSEHARAIICGGYDTVLGDGIVCKKYGDAPYISVIGVYTDSGKDDDCKITIKSGTYNYICVGNRDKEHVGNTQLVIDGGEFEGEVSVNGISNTEKIQKGTASLIVNGGVFKGNIGSSAALTDDLYITINGGTFRGNITAYGKINTIDINGGNLQSIGVIDIVDYITEEEKQEEDTDNDIDENTATDLPIETDTEGNPVTNENEETGEDAPEPKRVSTVNINAYSGDVNKLIEKIHGEDVVINKNTDGGSDVSQDTEIYDTTSENGGESGSVSSVNTEQQETDLNKVDNPNKQIFENKNHYIVAYVILAVVILLSVLALAYRAVNRK